MKQSFHQALNPSVQFSHSVVSDFATPWTAAHQASLPITNSQSLLKLISIERWCHPTISSSVVPFSYCPQSLPASVSFLMGQLFASGGQSIGASASVSVIPVNIQDWFPLGLTGLISLLSKGLSRVCSNTTVQKDQSSVLSFLYGSTLRSICDYWKDRHCDYVELCKQSNASAF